MSEFTSSTKDFMGAGLSFPLRVDPQTGRFVMSRHEENVQESVNLILHTYLGERVMRPEFGAMAENIMFTDLSATVIADVETKVRNALEDHEPRITDVSVKALRENKSELYMEVSYTVRTTNNQFNRVYPFFILEGEGG